MIKIGDFSKLSRVTVKALRYYDDLGLLRPVQIDEYNGYRYYSAEQLPRLNRILAYKDLGFSLEQIRSLLDENLSVEQMRGMLRLKQVEIRDRLRAEQDRLARVEARLKQIEQEDSMATQADQAYEVVLKKVAPQLVASVSGVIPNYDESEPIFDRLFDELYDYVCGQGARAGKGIALYHHTGEASEKDIQVEAVAPLYSPLKEYERVRIYELPGVETMACVVHHGPFASITQAYQALMRWIEGNGYTIAGPGRELYLQYERGGDQSQYVTEIQYPVARA